MLNLLKRVSAAHILLEIVDGRLKVMAATTEIDSELLNEIREKKAELEEFLKQNSFEQTTGQEERTIKPVPVSDGYELSSSQRRLWIISRIEEGNLAYNIPVFYRFEGTLDLKALEKSFKVLVSRHEILRTVFRQDASDDIFQYVLEDEVFSIDIDYLNLQDENSEEVLHQHIYQQITQAFDLSEGPLLRIKLIQTAPDQHFFCFVIHHIISDGWSMERLFQELFTLYTSFCKKGENPLKPLNIQYKDYAYWQQSQLKSGKLAQSKEYWLNRFRGELPVLELPTDFMRPAIKNYAGKILTIVIDSSVSEGLKKIAFARNGTMFMSLLAGVNALLFRYSNQTDIILGTPVAGRSLVDLEPQIGFYVNLLPIRAQFEADASFIELFDLVKKELLFAYEHQSYPFDELIGNLPLKRDISRNPLFDVSVILQNTGHTSNTGSIQLPNDLVIHPYQDGEGVFSKYDLTFTFTESDRDLQVSLEYDTNQYTTDRARRMLGHLEQLFREIIANPEIRLCDADFLTKDERKTLMIDFNPSAVALPEKTIIDLLRDQTLQTPEAVAVRCRGEKLTFEDLDYRSTRLACYLKKQGVQPETLIPICTRRSIDMVVGLMGILKAGAAYVPIDPDYPEERIAFILENTKASFVVCDEIGFTKMNVNEPVRYIRLEKDRAEIFNEGVNAVLTPILPGQLAYMIYTSGSTGTPKGVMIEHRSLFNFVHALDEIVPLTPKDHFLAVTSISFDISILELFWTLSKGVAVTIRNEQQLTSFDRNLNGEPVVMDFSLFYFSSQTTNSENKYGLLLKSVEFADNNDFTAVWTPERHFHEFGGIFPNPAVIGAALAATTKRLEIRSGSVVLPLHDVVRVAEEWSVVDNLSNGRVALSIASGWHVDDFVLMPENYVERQRIMFQQIEELKALWKGEGLVRLNGAKQEKETRIYPKPIQDELSISVTAGGHPETFINAGRIGANILTHLLGQEIEVLEKNIKLYKTALIENGHDVSKAKVALMLHTYIGSDLEVVKKTVREPFKEYLSSSASLLSNLTNDPKLDLKDLSAGQLDSLLELAFDRYWETSALMGTHESCRETVEKLHIIGVTEIACLIDFGIPDDTVFEGLNELNNFRKQFTVKATENDSNPPDITALQITPSYLSALIEDPNSQLLLKSLKHLLIGGEKLPASLIGKLASKTDATLYNMYGPTETTIWSCSKTIDLNADLTIGKPILNTQVYILDSNKNLCPIGIPGELYIGGNGLARGYFNDPELTNERFVTHTFETGFESRIYKTGDIAKWLPNGELDLIGRIDDQVKVNGYRIELGEIEHILKQHPAINDAVVAVRITASDDQQLIAYLVVSDDAFDASTVRTYLAAKLPNYMIPNHVILVNEIPLTANGKINKKALLLQGETETATVEKYVAPNNAVEAELTKIWSQILGFPKEKIGVKDNFFDLGGNSITLIKMLNAVNKGFEKEITLLVAFGLPNISALSEYIGSDSITEEEKPNETINDLFSTMESAFTLLNTDEDE
ncbi:MAG: LLM class flavin-dependent oxidoreductase [Fluviicola sp.]|nr:LLM class flavin-dependent oxidoreductase [Fluviicola sp.]